MADSLWEQLPGALKQIAHAEFQAGNSPVHILFNETRQIVLLAFALPPMTAEPPADVAKIHTKFAHENYCYDGTFCTYEEIRTGCLLAFHHPE